MKRILTPLLILILICSVVPAGSIGFGTGVENIEFIEGCGCKGKVQAEQKTQIEVKAKNVTVQGTGKGQEQKTQIEVKAKNVTVQGTEKVQKLQTKGKSENATGQKKKIVKQKTGKEQQVQNTTTQKKNQVIELKQMIQKKKQETKTLGNKNQNAVRLAVHSLLAMENLTGGIGKNISQIAREFNNSIQATIKVEGRIQSRSSLIKFFMGGDEEAAEEMEQEVNQNRLRIQELRRLMEKGDCEKEVKAMLQEQIQEMEGEQNRLQKLAQREKKDKGLFGWFSGLWK